MSSDAPGLSNRTERVLLVLSVVLYVVSLLLPAYKVNGLARGNVYPGWAALLLGPIGLFGGHFSWLANPALWYSWAVLRPSKRSAAGIWPVAALLAASTFLLHSTIPVGSSGNFGYTALYGYYMWLVSIALTVVVGLTSSSGHPASYGVPKAPVSVEDPRSVGECPNCKAHIPPKSTSCVHCTASFGDGAAWKVERQ